MKKQKNYTKGLVPIYIRITVNGKRVESATGRSCEPERWNYRSLNSFLAQLQNIVYDAHRALLKSVNLITAEFIGNVFMGKTIESQTLVKFRPN